MTQLSEMFSVIFITTAAASAIFGVYILCIKPKAYENRVFLACTLALAIWALGLGLAMSSPSEQICVFWRRFAAVGWGTFFSVLLHFILILTGKNSVLKKWWLYAALYLPAALNILVFTIPTGLNPKPFIMVSTPLGWTNVAENNAWDIYYMASYIVMMIAGLIIIWRWGLRSKESSVKRLAKILLITFITAFALGTVSDMFANSVFAVTIPQLGPIFILIPVTAIYISMRRFGMLSRGPSNINEEILSESARKRLYRYVTLALIAGAVMIFITQYVMNKDSDLPLTLTLCIVTLLAGAGINIVNRLKLRTRYKDFINILGLSIFIPIITLCYLQFGSITVWAFPFILIIISLVFNKRIVLFTVSFLTLLTQAAIWILSPHATVTIDNIAFATRIGIFAIGIALAFFVNRIYITRLRQNAEQVKLQTLVADISTDFVAATEGNIDIKIHSLLAKTGAFFETDIAFACLFDEKTGELSCKDIWRADETAQVRRLNFSFLPGEYPWWAERILGREVVHIPDTAKLPQQADTAFIQLLNTQCRSLLCIPAAGGNRVLGFLGFISIKTVRVWQEEHISLLKILSNTMTDAIIKTEAAQKLSYIAYYDNLTGLPNRLLFRDRLARAISQGKWTGLPLGVIFIDLDSFKSVNDTLGHERGDELLKIIADKLKKCVRQSDTVSRFSGDEFLMLINNLSKARDIIRIIENIMKIFTQPFVMKGQEFYITACAGIAMYPVDGLEIDKLIKNADIAMYEAKKKGRNQYVICSSEMKEAVNSNVSLTTSLYRALDRNELEVYYQPQVNPADQSIVGLEALLRWNSAEHGFISPGKFIPLAEQTGLINPIGEWVLKTACRQSVEWEAMGLPPVRMAVNLSVVQLWNPRLPDIVSSVLKETGLHPSSLELEITESAASGDSGYTLELLGRLKSLGISLSIDDFGTEYSSLSRLKLLPVDRIKMDIQFVRGIDGSDKDKAIAKSIISLAGSLGLKVIAEGVETDTQLKFLRDLKCDEIQGFYYFRPMPAKQIEAVLKRGNTGTES